MKDGEDGNEMALLKDFSKVLAPFEIDQGLDFSLINDSINKDILNHKEEFKTSTYNSIEKRIFRRLTVDRTPRVGVYLAPLNIKIRSITKHEPGEGNYYSYMAGWDKLEDNHYRLLVVAEVLDRDTGNPVELMLTDTYPNSLPKEEAYRDILRKIVSHEIDECIMVNGVRVFDPHKPEEVVVTNIPLSTYEIDIK